MAFIKQEFLECLKQLGLSQIETAQLLSVTPRTVNRWVENPLEISGPAEQALRAWQRLNYYNLPWRPDSVPLAPDDPELSRQISLLRNEAILLDVILHKVAQRGGPTLPWQVDLEKGTAKLETVEISFYRLWNDGFSPAMYRRKDHLPPDLKRDEYLIEEAIYCIHDVLSKERALKQSKKGI